MFIVLHFKYTAVRCYKSSIAPKEPLVKCRAILLHNTIFEPSLNSSRLPWCVLFIFVLWQLQIQIMKIDVSWVGQWITLGTLYCILSLCFAETLVHVRRALDAVLTSPHTSPSKFAKAGRNPTKKRNPAKMRNPRKMSKSGRTEMRPAQTATAWIWAIWATFWHLILPLCVCATFAYKVFLVDAKKYSKQHIAYTWKRLCLFLLAFLWIKNSTSKL